MEKYKVIALSVGGLGNKIFSAGDIVEAKNFPAGNAEKLVHQGFLEKVEEKKVEDPEKSTTKKTQGKRGR